MLGYHSSRTSIAPALWESGTDCLLSGLSFQRCLCRKQLWKMEITSSSLTRASLLTSQCKKYNISPQGQMTGRLTCLSAQGSSLECGPAYFSSPLASLAHFSVETGTQEWAQMFIFQLMLSLWVTVPCVWTESRVFCRHPWRGHRPICQPGRLNSQALHSVDSQGGECEVRAFGSSRATLALLSQ